MMPQRPQTSLSKPIFLVGYMGCGKSTLGRKLARLLHLRLVDTDQEVERLEEAAVSDIFHYEGEEHFRQREREVLEQLIAQGQSLVVSTGGGLPVWRDNMARMNESGYVIYIHRSAENIASRLSPYGRQKRPKLRGLNDEELVLFMRQNMAERLPWYQQAQLCLDADGVEDEELLNRILNFLQSR